MFIASLFGEDAMDTRPENTGRKLSTAAMCERYGISRRSLCRWMVDEKSGLPASLLLNGRHYWDEAEIVAWERASIAKRAA